MTDEAQVFMRLDQLRLFPQPPAERCSTCGATPETGTNPDCPECSGVVSPSADTDALIDLYRRDPRYRFTESEARLLADALAREREAHDEEGDARLRQELHRLDET